MNFDFQFIPREKHSLWKKVASHTRIGDSPEKYFNSRFRVARIDSFSACDHNYVYVTPLEVGQARLAGTRRRVKGC
jgi:hypothetical protein